MYVVGCDTPLFTSFCSDTNEGVSCPTAPVSVAPKLLFLYKRPNMSIAILDVMDKHSQTLGVLCFAGEVYTLGVQLH